MKNDEGVAGWEKGARMRSGEREIVMWVARENDLSREVRKEMSWLILEIIVEVEVRESGGEGEELAARNWGDGSSGNWEERRKGEK